MSQQATVSVVIPTFHRAGRTARAIESAAAQSLRPAEIIVVDDCSSDDSVARLAEQFGSSIRLISLDRNRGGGSARNAGARAASGDYIAFLDSDDVWFPDKLARQHDDLLRADGAAPAVGYCRAQTEFEVNGERFSPQRALRPGERVEDYLFMDRQDIQTSGLFMRRELFLQIGFTEDLRRHQDIDFVLRAQAQGVAFRFVDAMLYRRCRTDELHRDHVGPIRDDDISLNWIQSVRPLVGVAAYHRFIWERVMPHVAHRRPLTALRLAAQATLEGQPALGPLWRIARRELGVRRDRLAIRLGLSRQ